MLLVAMTACGASGAVEPHVRAASAPAAAFAGYRTFAIRLAGSPAAAAGPTPTALARRVRTLIGAKLILKGYVEQVGGGGRPDFVVALDPGQSVLVVSAFDARTDAQVWRASTEAVADPSPERACADDSQLRDEVGRLLATFPERSSEAGRAEVSSFTW
jgi:hypothetical protein